MKRSEAPTRMTGGASETRGQGSDGRLPPRPPAALPVWHQPQADILPARPVVAATPGVSVSRKLWSLTAAGLRATRGPVFPRAGLALLCG